MAARRKSGGNRSFVGELIFWIVLLGADLALFYMTHRSFGRPWNYRDTMPIMLPVFVFVPLAAVVLRYFPRKKSTRVIGCAVCVPVAILIGMVALHALYGEGAPLDRFLYGEPYPGATVGELESVTLSEYADGALLGEPLTLGEDYARGNDDFRRCKREVPEPDAYMLLTFTGANGETQDVRMFDDGKYDYISAEGLGQFRRKLDRNTMTNRKKFQDVYKDGTFYRAFNDHMADKSFALAKGYDGADKAVWLEDSEDATVWWTRFIPEGFEPERVEDVRFVFLCEVASKTYQGYWYVQGTGQKLGDSYDITYKMTAYDLAEGDTRVLVENTGDIFDARELVENYLEEKTGRKASE